MIIKRIEQWKKWVTALLLLLCLALCAVLFKAYLDGKFDSVETLQSYISGFGLLAPVVLTAIQALQVVIPVLPGFLGCIAQKHTDTPFTEHTMRCARGRTDSHWTHTQTWECTHTHTHTHARTRTHPP